MSLQFFTPWVLLMITINNLAMRYSLAKLAAPFFRLLLAPSLVTGKESLIRSQLRLMEFFGFRVYSPRLHDEVALAGHRSLTRDLMRDHVRRLARRPVTGPARIPRPKPVPEADRQEALTQILGDLEQAGARPFLCFGLLLGMIREGGFIPHDTDLDIGILLEEHDCAAIHAILLARGYVIECYEPDPWPCRLKLKLPGNTVGIDIVFFHAHAGFLQTYDNCYGEVLISNHSHFSLKRASFQGLDVWVPDDPELFLNESYRNWTISGDYHHYILTSPLMEFTTVAVEYCLLRMLALGLYRQDAKAVRGLLGLGRENYPHSEFWQTLQVTFSE